jgi:hypothetical protein
MPLPIPTETLKKLQPKLRMISNGDTRVNVVRAERCAALAVERPSTLKEIPTLRGPDAVPVALGNLKKKPRAPRLKKVSRAPRLSDLHPGPPSTSARRFAEGASKHKYGADVLIGIIDVQGFDFAHPDFLDANGKTRFVSIWDQGGDARPSPYDRDPHPAQEKT